MNFLRANLKWYLPQMRPAREKTDFLASAQSDQRFVISLLESMMSKLAYRCISIVLLVPVPEQVD